MAAIELFGLLWGQLQVAHMLKDIKGDWQNLRPLPAVAFFLSMPLVLMPSQAKRFLPLASIACGLYLIFYGSRSNHINQDCMVNLAIVLAAAGPRFERSLSVAVHWYLVALYLVSALHKLNSDWFDTHVSCASSVSGTLLAQYVPTMVPAGSTLSKLILETAPHAAAVFEVLLPGLLVVAPPSRSMAWQGACIRLAVILGSIFHLSLALPLPPASFYPFSASCLALYPLLMPDVSEKLTERFTRVMGPFGWMALQGLMLSVCAAANISGAWSSWVKGGPHDVPFEYPPYDLYNAGICWCFGVTGFLIFFALLGEDLRERNEAKKPNLRAAFVVVLATLFIGLGPYIGTRTYPAFAMFSNLRVEGSHPNHLFLGNGYDVLGLQSDTVDVLETNSSALRSFQVDLSQLFTSQTESYFAAAKLQKALWICPPKWSHEVKEFQAFSAPAVALYQRLGDTDVAWYARVRRGGVESIINDVNDLRGKCDTRVPTWLCDMAQQFVGPFRAFDDKYSPCRH